VYAGFEMVSKKQLDKSTIVSGGGILLMLIGIAIITIPHAPLRGTGMGTVALITGFVILLVGLFRLRKK
jgi:hypothetical protein